MHERKALVLWRVFCASAAFSFRFLLRKNHLPPGGRLNTLTRLRVAGNNRMAGRSIPRALVRSHIIRAMPENEIPPVLPMSFS